VELGAQVAPAGLAWGEALRRDPSLDLWAGDGQHPARLGSYLAACVFYAMLSGREPTRSRFMAGIESGQGRLLQQVAEKVLEDVRSGSTRYPEARSQAAWGLLTPVTTGLEPTLKIGADPADGA